MLIFLELLKVLPKVKVLVIISYVILNEIQLCCFLIPADTDDIKKEFDILLDELRRYNPEILDKDRLIAISKCDMLDDELKAELKIQLDKEFEGIPYMFISSVAQQGLTELKDKLWQMLN